MGTKGWLRMWNRRIIKLCLCGQTLKLMRTSHHWWGENLDYMTGFKSSQLDLLWNVEHAGVAFLRGVTVVMLLLDYLCFCCTRFFQPSEHKYFYGARFLRQVIELFLVHCNFISHCDLIYINWKCIPCWVVSYLANLFAYVSVLACRMHFLFKKHLLYSWLQVVPIE